MRYSSLALAAFMGLGFTKAANAQSAGDKVLAGTAWTSPGPFAKDMTPDKRAQLQSCKTPDMSFQMRGNNLVKRTHDDDDGSVTETVYAKFAATKNSHGTKIELFSQGGDGSKSSETFALSGDGESLKDASSVFGTAMVKCHSMQNTIGAPVGSSGGSNK